MKGSRQISQSERLEKRKVILAALTRATEGIPPLDNDFGEGEENAGEYYSLSQEEVEALINGDIETIKSWVNGLEKRQAAWLLRWLISDNW